MNNLPLKGENGRIVSSLSQIEKLEAQLQELKESFALIGERHSALPTSLRLRSIMSVRALRADIFQEQLFADPAWDILLFLYESFLDSRSASTSDVCLASGVPPTTALRWIDKLAESGLVVRTPDDRDGRRVMISLSSRAIQSMDAFFKLEGALERGI